MGQEPLRGVLPPKMDMATLMVRAEDGFKDWLMALVISTAVNGDDLRIMKAV